MKSKLIKLAACLGIFAFAFNVNAEVTDSTTITIKDGNNSSNAAATVGTVEAPVYEVAVIWNDLTFNWVYDEEENSFGWAPVPICYGIEATEQNVQDALQRGEEVYTDIDCSERVYSYSAAASEYYILDHRETTVIGIEDISQNGQIVPSIAWAADDKYSDVKANFSYVGEGCVLIPTAAALDYAKEYGAVIYSDNACQTVSTATEFAANSMYTVAKKMVDLTNGEIPDSGRNSAAGSSGVDGLSFHLKGFARNQYFVHLGLEGGDVTPTAGDKIGTITVSIRAK